MGKESGDFSGSISFLGIGYAVGYAFGYADLSRKKRNVLIGYAFGYAIQVKLKWVELYKLPFYYPFLWLYVLFKGGKYHIKNNANQHI